ncbi:MAG: GNAT family N-acetyltransferase, partial [Gudongella sp.]|nr:GNAT family N-acetyltransferase [Gudongella sp.]
ILFSEQESRGIYEGIFHRILIHAQDLEKVYIKVPTFNDIIMDRIERLGFIRQRYTYLMVRGDDPVRDEDLPEGFALRSFDPERDIDEWCRVRNIVFATVKGSETPLTPQIVSDFIGANDYLSGGMIMLTYKGENIGMVRGTRSEYEGKPVMNISSVGVLPEYQGRGFGRILLREAIRYAKRSGFDRTIISVNADNEDARKIYDREKFKEIEGIVCYEYLVH